MKYISPPKDYLTLGIFGRSGSGKTTLLKQAIRGQPRVVLYDPMSDFTGRGWTTHTGGQVDKLTRTAARSRVRASYQPAKGVDPTEALNAVSAAILDAQAGYKSGAHKSWLLFAIDELSKPFPLNAEKRCPEFVEICDRGRHYGIKVLGISQNINRTGMAFRDRLDAVCVGAQMRKGAQETAADMVGVHWHEIRDLKNYEFFAYSDGVRTFGKTKPQKSEKPYPGYTLPRVV